MSVSALTATTNDVYVFDHLCHDSAYLDFNRYFIFTDDVY